MLGLALNDWLLIGSLAPLLAASGFFSGTETALFSLSAEEKRDLAGEAGYVGRAVTRMLGDRRALLLTILIGNMTINVLFFVVSTVILIRLGEEYELSAWWLTPLSVLPLLAIVMFGEVLPKLLASRNTLVFTRFIALPFTVVYRGLTPLRIVLNAVVVTPLARLIEPGRRPEVFSAAELETLLKISKQEGIIDPDEEGMMQAIIDMSQLRVRHIMTPRVDIRGYDLDHPVEELYELIRHTRLSRLPVYRGDLDHIQGMVLSRDVLLAEPTDAPAVESLVFDIQFVPQLVRLNQLPEVFAEARQPMVIAVDEYGGTAGLVTLEDLMEHMVGEIAGPYDSIANTSIERIGAHEYRIGAGFPVEQWVHLLGIAREELDNSPRTLGGWMMAGLGRLPKVGDRLEIPAGELRVERMRDRRIATILLKLGQGHEGSLRVADQAEPGGGQ
ncbi:MAG: HlyC/CorC family transporter [Phycisphaeraceae bacterium]|nr:HlyC/CorC family transporter [Phycisphaeraceae bacterium]